MTRTMSFGWNGVGCDVLRLTYDVPRRTGTLWLPEEHHNDMDGAINFFKKIDPGVQKVEIFSGTDRDITYRVFGDRWEVSRDWRRKRERHPPGTLM